MFEVDEIVHVPKKNTTGYPWSDGRELEYQFLMAPYGGNAEFAIVRDIHNKDENGGEIFYIVPVQWLESVPCIRCPECGSFVSTVGSEDV